MNVRELLELAAKAAGLKMRKFISADYPYSDEFYVDDKNWNPLKDDGDALRLAVKLKMFVEIHQLVTTADIEVGDEQWMTCVENHNKDPYAATRKAIVRAAASIGKEMT